jgi:preprotein translocase subunit SecA
MFDFIGKAVAKVFGTKSDRDIKEVMPYVERTNAVFATLRTLSDDDLRGRTKQVQDTLADKLRVTDDQLAALHQRIADEPAMELPAKEAIFEQIDVLEKQRNVELEAALLEVLPDAFAIMKETARRYKENGELRVRATPLDELLADVKPNVTIDGETAIWSNKWTAAGAEITWDMVHYDVQLIGGTVLHMGKIAEMATGEGKTLVATLPMFLNALANRGVHIVTVNDYLAKRDSEWMAPLMEFHGISVDCIDKHQPNSDERRNAYRAHITYGTNNEFGFDYLRDNMARDPDELVQRKHHYAMVDEVDSVLIDDARTPLIISGPVPRGDVHEFLVLKPRIQRLVEEQKKVVNGFLVEARRLLKEGNEKEGGLALFRAYRGLPKSKSIIKFLSETGMRAAMNKTEAFFMQDNSRQMPEADKPLFFTIDEKNNQIELTEKGIDLITGQGEDPHFFIMPDIGTEIARIEQNNGISDDDKLHQKDALVADYQTKSERIHTVNQLLKAYTLFEKDQEYIISEDGKIKIVDEQTGRVMEGRRYSDGLHQAIEAKENVRIEDATQTYATVTLQNYFRMYHKLAGMTGTAETEAGEFWQIYKLDVVVIPTNRPITRKDSDDKVYKTVREKYNAVAEEIQEMVKLGRPVLVGTTSVDNSELISRLLKLRGIPHQVLNAKQHQREAEIVANAGFPGTVTIATNMAGRGTDIKLKGAAKSSGGLAIIGTERHESRRVDRQLRGRAGRQGDPGSSQFFVSLEDGLMRLFGSDRIARLMDRMGLEEGEVIQHSMISSSIERAQKKVEENNFGTRKRLLEYDDVMNFQREAVYKRRRNALYGERLELDVWNLIYDVAEEIVGAFKPSGDLDSLKLAVIRYFGFDTHLTSGDLASKQPQALTQQLYEEALGYYINRARQIGQQALPLLTDLYTNQGNEIENIAVPFSDGRKQVSSVANLERAVNNGGIELIRGMEKSVVLAIIDQAWTQHLRQMDDLKQVVQNAVYEQKDPLLIYKFESFELFKKMIGKVNQDTAQFLFHADIPTPSQEDQQRALAQQEAQMRMEQQRLAAQAQRAAQAQSYTTSFTVGSSAPSTVTFSGPAQQPQSGQGPMREEYQEQEVLPEGPQPKQEPFRAQKGPDRNSMVNVQYYDGRIERGVKYKKVEEDVIAGRAVLID